ncbi:hypothetical protein GCM10010300_01610 [Streptomyces olivaceoviridis]|nr:hypothetical protein GCM10010300_01610 [Streptomyces olivaceoviridis]
MRIRVKGVRILPSLWGAWCGGTAAVSRDGSDPRHGAGGTGGAPRGTRGPDGTAGTRPSVKGSYEISAGRSIEGRRVITTINV